MQKLWKPKNCFFFFCFLLFFFCFCFLFQLLWSHLQMVESACTSCWYTWHRGMDEICFYSYFFLFFSKWMDYTITPTSSLFPVPIIVPEWDLTCSTSPSYRLVSGFIQLYLYWLLAVIYSQGVLSHVDCTWTTSPPDCSLVTVVMSDGIAFCRFRRVWSNQSSSTPNRCIDSVASD